MSQKNEPAGHDALLNYHRARLKDAHRMDAFECGIRAVVKPGDVVLDLGAGTGVLAVLPARRGAARVYTVESMDIADMASELVEHNGPSHVTRVHRADIREMAPVEPGDVVVSDFFGLFLVDDRMLQATQAAALAAARRRLFTAARLARAGAGRRYWLRRSRLVRGGHGRWRPDMVDGVRMTNGPGYETHWGQQLFPVPGFSAEAGDILNLRLRMDDDGRWRWTGAVRRGHRAVMSFHQEGRAWKSLPE